MRKLKRIGTIATIGLVVSLGGLATPATAALEGGGFSVKAENESGQYGISGSRPASGDPGGSVEEPPAPWRELERIDMSCQAASTWAGGTDRVWWPAPFSEAPVGYRASITVGGETEVRELSASTRSLELDSYELMAEKRVQVQWYSKSQKRWSESHTVLFPEKHPDELNSSCWQILAEG